MSLIKLFHVRNLVSSYNCQLGFQRDLGNISQRYIIGQRCKKCKKLSQSEIKRIANNQEKREPPKPKAQAKSFASEKCNMEKHEATDLQCFSDKCVPTFRVCPPSASKWGSEYLPVLKKCNASMLNPYEAPPVGPDCYLSKGKMGYTTNERKNKEFLPCPKGDWRYRDWGNCD